MLVRTGFVRLIREMGVDHRSCARINRVTGSMAAVTDKLEAIVSPPRTMAPPARIEVRRVRCIWCYLALRFLREGCFEGVWCRT